MKLFYFIVYFIITMSLLSCKIYNEMHMMKSNKKQVLREEDYKLRQTSISWKLKNNHVHYYNPRKISIYSSLHSLSNSSLSSLNSNESDTTTIKQKHSSFIYNPNTDKYIDYEIDSDEEIKMDVSNNNYNLIIDNSCNLTELQYDDTYHENVIHESYI